MFLINLVYCVKINDEVFIHNDNGFMYDADNDKLLTTENFIKNANFIIKEPKSIQSSSENENVYNFCLKSNTKFCLGNLDSFKEVKFYDKKIIKNDEEGLNIQIKESDNPEQVFLIIKDLCITKEESNYFLKTCEDSESQLFHLINSKVKKYYKKSDEIRKLLEKDLYVRNKNSYLFDDVELETPIVSFNKKDKKGVTRVAFEAEDWYYRIRTGNIKYLDYSDLGSVKFTSPSSESTQKFILRFLNEKTVNMVSLSGLYCLTVNNQGILVMNVCNSKINQKFILSDDLYDKKKPFYLSIPGKEGFVSVDVKNNKVTFNDDQSKASLFLQKKLIANQVSIEEGNSGKFLGIMGNRIILNRFIPTPISISYYHSDLVSIKFAEVFCLTLGDDSKSLSFLPCEGKASQIFEMVESIEGKMARKIDNIRKRFGTLSEYTRLINKKDEDNDLEVEVDKSSTNDIDEVDLK